MLQFAEIAGCSVNPHSNVDWVAIAGIIGTLAGTALGAYVTWKIQKLQVEHENKVRFHERRLAIYADYTDASNKAFANFQAGIDSGDQIFIAARLWETLRLIASQKVVNAAIPIHLALNSINFKTVTNPAEFSNAFNANIVKLIAVMRAEIGIDSKS
jgi:hypothetical protein